MTALEDLESHDSRLLEFYFINAGVGEGESTIVHMPDGQWGVIDCYAPSVVDPNSNSTLQLLNRLSVSELEFCCLTHPHRDHYRGMSQILRQKPVRQFWQFGGMSGEELTYLVVNLRVRAEESSIDELIRDSSEIQEIFKLAGQVVSRTVLVNENQQLYPQSLDESTDIRITAIAPTGSSVKAYQEQLYRCFDGRRLKEELPHRAHNLVSCAFCIDFGETRIVLGGDVEREAWLLIMDTCFNASDRAVHCVKVSHHGSANGYCEGLWGRFSKSIRPIAVVFPYQRFGLPSTKALDHIRPHVSELLATFPLTRQESVVGSRPDMIDVDLALETKFRATRKVPPREPGWWRLSFDDKGHCVRRESTGQAVQLS